MYTYTEAKRIRSEKNHPTDWMIVPSGVDRFTLIGYERKVKPVKRATPHLRLVK